MIDRIIGLALVILGLAFFPARGTGIHEAKTFFGLTLEAQTDAVLFLLEESLVARVLDSIYTSGRLKEPGAGIALVIDVVEHAVGIESQLERFRRASENHD